MAVDPPYARTDDVGLVIAIARYNGDAFAEAYRRHAGAVFGLAHRLLWERALAEELVQEIFLRLWEHPDRFDQARGSLRSFLLMDAHARCVDRIRSDTPAQGARGAHRPAPRWSPTTTSTSRPTTSTSPSRSAKRWRRSSEASGAPSSSRTSVGTPTVRWRGSSNEPEGTIKSRIRTGLTRLRTQLRRPGNRRVMDRELTPDEITELLPAYALDAVDDDERALVDAYLDIRTPTSATRSTSSRCRVDARARRWTAARGRLGATRVPIIDRHAATDAVVPPTVLTARSTPAPDPASSDRRWRWLAAAAAIVALVFGGLWLVERRRRQRRPPTPPRHWRPAAATDAGRAPRHAHRRRRQHARHCGRDDRDGDRLPHVEAAAGPGWSHVPAVGHQPSGTISLGVLGRDPDGRVQGRGAHAQPRDHHRGRGRRAGEPQRAGRGRRHHLTRHGCTRQDRLIRSFARLFLFRSARLAHSVSLTTTRRPRWSTAPSAAPA